jgi:hypothetical protein
MSVKEQLLFLDDWDCRLAGVSQALLSLFKVGAALSRACDRAW